MSDGTELERRIHAALDRITAAADGLSADTGGGEDLSAALEAERMANAQLEERVKAIKERQESLVGRLEQEVSELKDALAARDTAVRKVRQTNGKLRETNQALRAANARGVGDPDLINSALSAELDALRALQEQDRAELDEVLVSLEPITQEVSHA